MSTAIAASTWQGVDLRHALRVASTTLDQHREELNALNVFPVPDGDTGINMSLTMHGALDALETLPKDAGLATVARTFAHGALMGARGNSGVILSQFFRGIASALDDDALLDGASMQAALASAAEAAYAAVDRPVEGTMLTVIRAAGSAATDIDDVHPSIQDVLDRALERAIDALANTPSQLDILRTAGVIDAGGQGIVHLFTGLAHGARSESISPSSSPERVPSDTHRLPAPDLGADAHVFDDAGYCTNFMLYGESMDVSALRGTIGSLGDSVVVVGEPSMLKVHIHTHDPIKVLTQAARIGSIDQVRIDDMNRQRDAIVSTRSHTSPNTNHQAVSVLSPISIVAVTPGPGIGDAFRSLGADIIVSGTNEDSLSPNDLVRAVESVATDQVLLLPDNTNTLQSAREVGALTRKTIRVVPTVTVPAVLMALSAFNIDLDLDSNARQMERIGSSATAITLTTSARDRIVNGMAATTGQIIGMLDDTPVATGDRDAAVISQVLEHASVSDPELFTIFAGEDVSAAEQDIFITELAAQWPDSAMEMVSGGQVQNRFIISVE